MSYASQLIERLIRESSPNKYTAFVDLLNSYPSWFPKKAKVDISKSTKKLIYCTLDQTYPMSSSALQSFKNKILEKAQDYFDTVSITDNDEGFSILVG